MKVEMQVPINASREAIWQAITDIENAAGRISGIEKVEMLERPGQGLVGLKWRETRKMFGKEATEVMWITEAQERQYYKTRAESHGALYTSVISVVEEDGQNYLRMEFTGKPQTTAAKIMSFIMTPLFKSATKKALRKDLEDIRDHLESK